MKTSGRQRKRTTDASPKSKLGCTKSGASSKKPTKQRQKGKRNTEVGRQLSLSPVQPSPQQNRVLTQETAPGRTTSFSGQCLSCSRKFRLQLFPMDEATCKGLEMEKHNPYLELTLSTRKKISSVVKHLNIKWGTSRSASGELMLFPYDSCPDNLASLRRWTLRDSDTSADDVYAALGSPAIFRLRYGWFSNPEPAAHGMPLASPYSEGNLEATENQNMDIVDETAPTSPLASEEHGPVNIDDSLNPGANSPIASDKSVEALDNQRTGKGPAISWAECLSDVSVGALLAETSIPNANLPLPIQKISSLQHIPISCDSFDAALAALFYQHPATNQSIRMPHSSIWDADETCHGFPFQKCTSSQKDSSLSKDAAFALCAQNVSSNSLRLDDKLGSQVAGVLGNICQEPATNMLLSTETDACVEPAPGSQPCVQDDTGEVLKAGSQPQTQHDASKELIDGSQPQAEISNNDNNPFGGTDIYLQDSMVPLEPITPCSRQMSGGDSISFSGLITSSLDAFQNFSIF